MNPFDAARTEAARLRDELVAAGISLDQPAYNVVIAACRLLDIKLKKVKPTFPLLKGADATINIARHWLYVRDDVPDEIKAFLIAHELGHLRLHPLHVGVVEVKEEALTAETSSTGARDVEGYGARERQELQANVFSREFLLPRAWGRALFIDDGKSASVIAGDGELPLELVRLQLYDGVLLPEVTKSSKTYSLPAAPTAAQRPAVESTARVSLVQAGPGTGKTTALLLRLRNLIAQGVAPESIVILTFSNKAARELVERARAGKIPNADRVWIGTFHAFGLEFLRKFGALRGLEARFPVLDKLAALAMLEADLPNLELVAFDPFSNPSPWLEGVVDTIRRAKDEVLNAAGFERKVAESPAADATLAHKRRDVATIFHRYELLLKRRKAIDLTDLLCVAIELLQSGDQAVAAFKAGIKHVLVDEYQDVNRASALLVRELAQAQDKALWVVGDANQAIYAFMGASSTNLDGFVQDFPDAKEIPLLANHRSSMEIVDVFTRVASRNPAGRTAVELKSEMGPVGHGPNLVNVGAFDEKIAALAWRIRKLESDDEIPLAEQAVIAYRNATAAAVAAALEAQGLPVLFLGNIFERPEVKDLLCLLQLAVDPLGVNLVRRWYSPLLALSREGADRIFRHAPALERHWMDTPDVDLSPTDRQALESLLRMCRLVEENDSPWDALAKLLLEDGCWLRDLAKRQDQAGVNARMAVWQFVHFCRAPDGTGRWSTVKNLPQRIRDRVRLNEDRSTRVVPPEAEGLNAVRILTAHGSKGLEFDAIHLVEAAKAIFEPDKPDINRLMPESILSKEAAFETLRNERHNLLYVAISRPRLHLTVYLLAGEELPSALNGQLQLLGAGWPGPGVLHTSAAVSPRAGITVELPAYLEFVKCPRRHEMRTRAGGALRDELKMHRAIGVAAERSMRALMTDRSLLGDQGWKQVAQDSVRNLKNPAFAESAGFEQRVFRWVGHGRDFLLQGGQQNVVVPMKLGPLTVTLRPEQVFNDGGTQRLRFIRTQTNIADAMKQPMAALLDFNKQSNGPKMAMEIAVLQDGTFTKVNHIQANTRLVYDKIAKAICAEDFPAQPKDGDRICHFCPYMFPCDRRSAD
jgi:superfamily I DNA/RNA helicase/Zn-dependent peptidase ImmA (M78 family)